MGHDWLPQVLHKQIYCKYFYRASFYYRPLFNIRLFLRIFPNPLVDSIRNIIKKLWYD